VKERKGKTGKLRKKEQENPQKWSGQSEDFHPLCRYRRRVDLHAVQRRVQAALVCPFSAAGETFACNINLDALKAIHAGKCLCCCNILWENRKHL